MKVVSLNNLKRNDYLRIVERSRGAYKNVLSSVRRIMKSVKYKGDEALFKANRKYYGKNIAELKVSIKEISLAYNKVNKDFIGAMKQMIKNIESVSKAQLPPRGYTKIYTENGISVSRKWNPIEKVGLYIPGGKANYPSSVLMSAIPAKVAGCTKIILCSPPRDGLNIPPSILVAADLAGVTNIYKVGGAEAIAAMTFGTTTIPKVYKIFGAGNLYVTAAKLLAFEEVAIDMPAGPSEVFIIADNYANPKFIAADLLADAEHGEDSACVLITNSPKIAVETISEIKKQTRSLTTGSRAMKSIENYGLFATVNRLEEAISFTNTYAPEHLEIMTRKPEAVASQIKNAGSIFLGNWTSKATGDYATGANHILPTGGSAKMYSALGVDAFGKWTEIQKCNKEGLKKIKKTIEVVATVEELPAHKNSVTIRF